MAFDFKLRRQVEFSDTDMAGIVHFSRYFQYMEATEHAFYRSLGCSVHESGSERKVGWPRVGATCEYRAPLRFEETVEIHLLVREKREKSLRLEFIFRKIDGDLQSEVARGSLTVVCADIRGLGEKMVAMPIPQEMAQRIEEAPAGLFAKEI